MIAVTLSNYREGGAMDNPFEWLTSKFKQPLSLAFFAFGALLILLGITTGLEIQGLKQLAADPQFRWISIASGLCLLLVAIFIAYRPPAEPVLHNAANWPYQRISKSPSPPKEIL